MRSTSLLGALAGAAILVTAQLAAAGETIRMAVTDVAGMEELQREFQAFSEALTEATGMDVELFPVNSRTAAVEAMRAKQVDFVLTGPAEYVVFKQLTDAKPVVGWQRPDYFAQIVVLAGGPVKSIDDLKGQTVSFGAIGSTSQHLGPAQALADFGLMYDEDYKAEIIPRNVAVEALIRGDIQAVGMNFSHLGRIREAFPDVGFKVIARGRDLPNDILIASPDVAPETVETVRKAFHEQGGSLIDAILQGEDNQKYRGGVFLPEIADADYDYVRAMYTTINQPQFSNFIGD